MDDCLFCKIVTGDIPSKKVYEDDKILAFYDISPMAKVHVLVIPKVHITSVQNVTEENSELIGYLFSKIPHIATLLEINERGTYEDFILKCKERLCSFAQLAFS